MPKPINNSLSILLLLTLIVVPTSSLASNWRERAWNRFCEIVLRRPQISLTEFQRQRAERLPPELRTAYLRRETPWYSALPYEFRNPRGLLTSDANLIELMTNTAYWWHPLSNYYHFFSDQAEAVQREFMAKGYYLPLPRHIFIVLLEHGAYLREQLRDD